MNNSTPKEELSLCGVCGCMTKTIYSVTSGGQCGKCGCVKPESTTELTTTDIDKIYEILNRHISEKFGVEVDFPSKECFDNL